MKGYAIRLDENTFFKREGMILVFANKGDARIFAYSTGIVQFKDHYDIVQVEVTESRRTESTRLSER